MPGVPQTSAHRISPSTSRRHFSRSSARPVRRARWTIAQRNGPVNIGPFSMGLHHPIAFGRHAAQSSGVGSSPT